MKYFKKYHSITLARKFRRYLLDTCIVIKREEIKEQINELKGKIKEKDMEQLATSRKYRIKFLISYDRDFEGFEEYITQRQFLSKMKIEVTKSEF